MNKDQSLTWEFLIILGVVVLIISPLGEWLARLVEEITTPHKMKLTFNPFTNPLDALGEAKDNLFHGTMIPGNGNGGNGTSLWNVPIIGADGTPGSIQVVSSSQAGAFENAHQGGNTPTGSAVPA